MLTGTAIATEARDARRGLHVLKTATVFSGAKVPFAPAVVLDLVSVATSSVRTAMVARLSRATCPVARGRRYSSLRWGLLQPVVAPM